MPAIIGCISRCTKRFLSQQKGFTSLQLAIAAASSLVLAGGVTATAAFTGDDLAMEVDKQITESLTNIMGTYMIRSSIYGQAAATGSNGELGQLIFTVGIVARGGSADFTPPSPSTGNNGLAGEQSQNAIVISYTDSNQHIDNLYWTVTPIGRDDGDYLLEDNELFQITLGGGAIPGENGGNLVDALNIPLTTNTVFTIEMGSSQGAVLVFDRRTPSYLRKVTNFR
ncbi:MAG: hypothetical protein JXA46_09455 [Dehalococcoidales bacterium]|nr:hypothetical protein [Dehalococcoidales bacterium]